MLTPRFLHAQALGLAALSAVFFAAPKAQAALTEDLLARTAANKVRAAASVAAQGTHDDVLIVSSSSQALNDSKRLATSGANFARSRTVTDGTCAFPNNMVGCENAAETGSVKYLSDDLKLECEGTEAGKARGR